MPDTMTFDKELTAIQTWVKQTTKLNSWRLSSAPSVLARPVIIWDTPSRSQPRNVSRYEYVIAVKQYGRLCVNQIDDAIQYQNKLFIDLGERCNNLPVIEGGVTYRKLKNVQLEFTGEDLEASFTLSYEVSYYRTKPPEAPHATRVTTKLSRG